MDTSDTPPAGPGEPSEAADAAELVGTTFADRFSVVRLVSEGANTVIYDAIDTQSGRPVTLKLVRTDLSASPSFRRRFDETMRSVAALSHPNIAAVFDWGMAPIGTVSTAYVVIEHLSGGSLRDMFDRGRQLSPSQALAVGLDACRGLDYAHRRGFVHTELTPSKLVFGDDRRLRIIDFGLARLLGETAWKQPDSVSTHVAWYASPEQGLGLPIDGTTDVYALCLSLHEAVTGTLPFAHDSTVASLTARVGKLMPVSADLGPLASVFERAGRPEADERSTAAEFGKALVQAASKLPRPEPLPLLSTGLFDVPADQMRTPADPTGGVNRPPGEVVPVLVVPVDEPDAASHDDDGDGHAALLAGGAIAAAGAAAAVSTAAHDGPTPPTSDAGGSTHDATEDHPPPAAPTIIERDPEAELPGDASVADGDLVILPIDSDIDRRAEPSPPLPATDVTDTAPTDFVARPEPAPTQPLPITQVEAMPRRRRGFPWKILLGLLVVAALVTLGLLASRLFATPTYIVPELTEMPRAEALNLIAPNGWEVSESSERSDEVPVVDQVVRTVPAAGVELAEGEPFLLVVSEGPLLRELPDSTGLQLSEAQTNLLELSLEVETREEFDEVVPDRTVISWSVPGDPTLTAGAMVEPGTPVELVVSKGPAPRAVPDVVGHPVGEARAEVEALQLGFAESGRVFSDDAVLGTVISQSIEPGSEVERGSEVTVVVSNGPDLVVFPDISAAASYEEAAAILTPAGFVPYLTFGDAQGAIQSYNIAGETPTVGQTYRRGTQVDFVAL